MAETRLGFNKIEARGLYGMQQGLLKLAAQAAQLQMQLQGAEAEAAELLTGRVPAGVTLRTLRIDQDESVVYAPEGSPAGAPGPLPSADVPAEPPKG